MAVNWNTLPVEIRLSVFNHVGDIKQLVESRLVRKIILEIAQSSTINSLFQKSLEKPIEPDMQAVENAGNTFIKDWYMEDIQLIQNLITAVKSDKNSLKIGKAGFHKANSIVLMRAKRNRSKERPSFLAAVSEGQSAE